jgi:crossover junction endonuclease EME1
LGLWEPVPERIEREHYAMVIVPAAQFVDLALGQGTSSLESHVRRMKRHFPGDTIIYLIEGLDLWLRKNRNIRNRQFVSAVRNGLEQQQQQQQQQQKQPLDDPNQHLPVSSAQAPKPRQRKANTPASKQQQQPQTYIDEEIIEETLLTLQVHHGSSTTTTNTNLLIHHTALPVETARQIAVFTQHISTAPYRLQRDAARDAGFCMESGQVRTGDGPSDTYARLLQEIARVTAPIAYGIAAEYPSVPRLVAGLERDGPLALEKVRRSMNKEGEVGERTVGQAVSRRVYKIFMGRDETSTDI